MISWVIMQISCEAVILDSMLGPVTYIFMKTNEQITCHFILELCNLNHPNDASMNYFLF